MGLALTGHTTTLEILKVIQHLLARDIVQDQATSNHHVFLSLVARHVLQTTLTSLL